MHLNIGSWFIILAFSFVLIITIVIIVCVKLSKYIEKRKSPFRFPYFEMEFDVSGKRNPRMEDYIDMFLINNGRKYIIEYERSLKEWHKNCEQLIEQSSMPDYRREQYDNCIFGTEQPYIFSFVRNQTRYRQRNHVKHSYSVKQTEYTFRCDLNYLNDREIKLHEIGYECPLSTYFAKDQRSKMTTALKQQIKERDNYTCKKCGKYMPDEVGLQIDHIIPVAKGGKSIPSNLQVLCSKCNGKKHDKLVSESQKA